MSERETEERKTQVGGALDYIIPFDEEQNPLPDDPSPAMLVARVTERLAQAAFTLMTWQNDWELEDADDDEYMPEVSLFQVAVFFIGAAVFAITAIPHILPDSGDMSATELKDHLLDELDEGVAEYIEDEESQYYEADLDTWLKVTLSLLIGATHSVCGLEGVTFPRGDQDANECTDVGEMLAAIEASEVEDLDEDELLDNAAESLMSVAVMAATAGEWFLEQHEGGEVLEEGDEGKENAVVDSADVAAVSEERSLMDEQMLMDELAIEPDSWTEGPLATPELTEWDSEQRWSYRESSASASRRNQSRLSIAISDTPKAFARRLTRPSRSS